MKIRIIADTFANGNFQYTGDIIDCDDITARILIENHKAQIIEEDVTDVTEKKSKRKEK